MFAIQLSQILDSPWPCARRPLSSLLAPPLQSIISDPSPGSYQKKSGIWRIFLSQPRFWCLSFIFVSGSKLLKRGGIFLLNSTSFGFCFSSLRYILFLFILMFLCVREQTLPSLSVYSVSLFHLFYMVCLLIIYF